MHRAETRERSKAAIGAGNHTLAAHQIGVTDDSLRDKFRMLDIVEAGCNNAWNQDLVIGKLLNGPNLPLMLVTRIRALQQKSHRLRLEHDRQNLRAKEIAGRST